MTRPLRPSHQRVLDWLNEHGTSTAKAVADALGLKAPTAHKYLRAMEQQGSVRASFTESGRTCYEWTALVP